MFQILSFTKGNILAIRAQDKLVKEDYEKIQPLLKKKVEDFGAVKLYLEIKDLKGITAKALSEDFKTFFSYFNKIDNAAVIGEGIWIRALSESATPFIKGRVKYFKPDESLEAKRWIEKE